MKVKIFKKYLKHQNDPIPRRHHLLFPSNLILMFKFKFTFNAFPLYKKEGRVNDSFCVMSMLDGHIVLSYVDLHQAIWKHDYIMLLRYANILHI